MLCFHTYHCNVSMDKDSWIIDIQDPCSLVKRVRVFKEKKDGTPNKNAENLELQLNGKTKAVNARITMALTKEENSNYWIPVVASRTVLPGKGEKPEQVRQEQRHTKTNKNQGKRNDYEEVDDIRDSLKGQEIEVPF